MLKKIVMNALELIKRVETEWCGKTGEQKKAAAVKMLCETINIPFVPEWLERIVEPPLYGSIIEIGVKWMNGSTGGHVEAFPVTEDTAEALASVAKTELLAAAKGALPVEIPKLKTPEAPNITDINNKFDELVAKYGV